jgi:hypothetical protein
MNKKILGSFRPPSSTFSLERLGRNEKNLIDVMLSPSMELRINSAKHLAFSVTCEDEILRLRLRMTIRHSFEWGKTRWGCFFEVTPITPSPTLPRRGGRVSYVNDVQLAQERERMLN